MSQMIARSADASPNMIATGFAGAIAMACAMGFGRFSFTPILPGMISGVPLSAADAGYIAAANFAGYLAGAVLSAFGWANGRERQVAVMSLAANCLLLVAMGISGTVAVFVVIRFLAGLASGFAMVFISSIVLSHAVAARNDHVQSAHFGGVGLGIALSSFLVMLIGQLSSGGTSSWRIDWFAGAAVSLLGFLAVCWLLPWGPARGSQPHKEPPLAWSLPLVLTTMSYGLFGFGYVITATFLVTIARMADAGPMVEFLSWFIAGLAAAVSLLVWKPVRRARGIAQTFMLGILVEAIGVAASVSLPPVPAVIVCGLLFGGTFMAVTAYGLQIGRILSPASPRRALAFMTAAFGIGQMCGPLAAGWAAQATGSFTLPTVMGATALMICIALIAPVAHRIE